MEERADTELVALARAGDKGAFGHLIERYQPMARYIALGMVANEDIAQELAQEAMLQAYLSLDHLRDDRRFKSWLYGIVLNVCRSYVRDQKVDFFSWEAIAGGLQFGAIPFSGLHPDPQEMAEEQELHRLVLAAIATLSPKNRAATLLFYYEQLSLQEIAAILGVSVVAVKGRLHKARNQLKQWLLPLFLETDHTQRRKTMIKVTVADVVKQEREDKHFQVVVLLDEAGRRALPIWVGPVEGQAIAMGLREYTPFRPMTFDFMAKLLQAAGVEVEEVRVEALKEDTFYAIVKLHCGDRVREIDARPSDAIALALRLGSPIYVAEGVWAKAGFDIPEETGKGPGLGQGLDDIVKEWEGEQQAFQSRPCPTKEEKDEAYRELMAFMFGGRE